LSYKLSENIKLVLQDGDIVWPTTMDGEFRIVNQKEGHNILGGGEHPVSEQEMISGVLNQSLPSRWRSKTNDKRKISNHFSVTSPSVKEVHVNVGGVWIQHK
jgi:hypothetical protein